MTRFKCPTCGKEFEPEKFPNPDKARVMTPTHYFESETGMRRLCDGAGKTPLRHESQAATWPDQDGANTVSNLGDTTTNKGGSDATS